MRCPGVHNQSDGHMRSLYVNQLLQQFSLVSAENANQRGAVPNVCCPFLALNLAAALAR
jgi:hypothetical protein